MVSIPYRQDYELPPTPLYHFDKIQAGNVNWKSPSLLAKVINSDLDKIEEAIKNAGGSGTTNYNALTNKPKINTHELMGDMTLDTLGIQAKLAFDEDPTEHSTNPVTSNGTFKALSQKVNISTSSASPDLTIGRDSSGRLFIEY